MSSSLNANYLQSSNWAQTRHREAPYPHPRYGQTRWAGCLQMTANAGMNEHAQAQVRTHKYKCGTCKRAWAQAHTNKRGQAGMSMDEGHWARSSTDERGRARKSGDGDGWAGMSGDGPERVGMSGDGQAGTSRENMNEWERVIGFFSI